MDNADHAQELIEMRTNHAIQRVKAKFAQIDGDELYCQACGVEIPQARRKAIHNCKYCIDCQQQQELRHRQQMGK